MLFQKSPFSTTTTPFVVPRYKLPSDSTHPRMVYILLNGSPAMYMGQYTTLRDALASGALHSHISQGELQVTVECGFFPTYEHIAHIIREIVYYQVSTIEVQNPFLAEHITPKQFGLLNDLLRCAEKAGCTTIVTSNLHIAQWEQRTRNDRANPFPPTFIVSPAEFMRVSKYVVQFNRYAPDDDSDSEQSEDDLDDDLDDDDQSNGSVEHRIYDEECRGRRSTSSCSNDSSDDSEDNVRTGLQPYMHRVRVRAILLLNRRRPRSATSQRSFGEPEERPRRAVSADNGKRHLIFPRLGK
jgi:hypothetical protein